MIRPCSDSDLAAIHAIINDAAAVYQGVIPPDCWHEPYMPLRELRNEISQGVVFWGFQLHNELAGVMGIQDKDDVSLIRHAYVRTSFQGQGIGKALLRHLEGLSGKPILIGTWMDASWAIRFYENNGYAPVSRQATRRLLKTYWNIPDRQVETSVVLTQTSPSLTSAAESRRGST